MKKIIAVIIVVITLFTLTNKSNEVLIPDEAIRFRIIANSDNNIDQNIKMLVKDNVEEEMFNDIRKSNSIIETRSIINNKLPKYEQIVSNVFDNNNIKESFKINYGINYFPEKEYKGVKYKEGEYESLVLTLGEGKGNNWWCVLFPPLCLLDAKEEAKTDKVEYKFFVKELIDKFFK